MLTALKLYLIVGELWAVFGLLQPAVWADAVDRRAWVAAMTVVLIVLTWPRGIKRVLSR